MRLLGMSMPDPTFFPEEQEAETARELTGRGHRHSG
jgi:hypothetical protein